MNWCVDDGNQCLWDGCGLVLRQKFTGRLVMNLASQWTSENTTCICLTFSRARKAKIRGIRRQTTHNQQTYISFQFYLTKGWKFLLIIDQVILAMKRNKWNYFLNSLYSKRSTVSRHRHSTPSFEVIKIEPHNKTASIYLYHTINSL